MMIWPSFVAILMLAHAARGQGANCTDQGGCIWACDQSTNLCADAVGQVICVAAFTLRQRDKPNGMVLGEWPHNDRAVVMEGPVVLNGLYWYRLLPVAKSNATSVWSAWGTDPTVGPWFLTCADQPRFVSPNVTNVTTLTSASTTVTVINATITDTTNNATVADLTSEEGGQALLIGGIVAAVVLAILLLLLFLMIAGKFGRSSSERETFDVPNDHYEEPTHNGAPLPRATEVSVDVGGTTLVAAETIDEPMPESNRYNDLVLKPANNYVSAPKSQKTPRYSVGAMSTFVEPKK